MKYGPNTAAVTAFIDSLATYTAEDWVRVRSAYTDGLDDGVTGYAYDAAYFAAYNAYRLEYWHTAREDATAWRTRRAAAALVVRDLIRRSDFELLAAGFKIPVVEA